MRFLCQSISGAVLLALCVSCAQKTEETSRASKSTPGAERIVSFLGEPLEPIDLPDDVEEVYESKLAKALQDFEAHPESLDALVWLGRRQAYLGQYREAIRTFTAGIERHPGEPQLYRHRGHRFITTRQLNAAIVDLETAARLIEGTDDQIEPDGLPNDRGIPTSTLHSNIWYHLGLARYLEGDFEGALEAYTECLRVSKNPDMLVATTHWMYMTLRRMGLENQAQRILTPITPELDVIENHEYHQLLLLYREDRAVEDLADPDDGLASATLGYGIGNWHLYNQRNAEANAVFQQILRSQQWAAFGFLAAEAEVARSRDLPLR